MDAVDKFFKKKGTTLKTGDAIAAEAMAKADRDKKIFREEFRTLSNRIKGKTRGVSNSIW